MRTLITHPNFDSLWAELEKRNPNEIVRAKIRFESFPDGWPNLFIEDVKEKIEHREVTYIGDFSRPEYLFPNYAIIRGILDYYADKVRVIVPFFPVGTMERISKKWEVATASYFADLLSHLPNGRSGKTSLHTFDIHALVERFLFDSFQVNAELHTTLSLLDLPQDTVIAFPDDGAAKRFHEAFPWHDRIICAKVRWVDDQRSISIKEGNPDGRDIVIIDDLIQTGGTLREAALMLRERGAKSVRAFAPHGVFPGESHVALAASLDELIVTDTIPANIARASEVVNMRVVSTVGLVEKIVLGE